MIVQAQIRIGPLALRCDLAKFGAYSPKWARIHRDDFSGSQDAGMISIKNIL
jgi:hypothetical protein